MLVGQKVKIFQKYVNFKNRLYLALLKTPVLQITQAQQTLTQHASFWRGGAV